MLGWPGIGFSLSGRSSRDSVEGSRPVPLLPGERLGRTSLVRVERLFAAPRASL